MSLVFLELGIALENTNALTHCYFNPIRKSIRALACFAIAFDALMQLGIAQRLRYCKLSERQIDFMSG